MDLVRLVPAAYHTTDSYWHLLNAEDGSIYILVECEASFVSYECLIKLNDEELRDYCGLGWLSIQHRLTESITLSMITTVDELRGLCSKKPFRRRSTSHPKTSG